VKHKLKAQHYIRYVDDFVILHKDKTILEYYEDEIQLFLKSIKLELHPDKSKIILLSKGVTFLGYRIFRHHKLLKKSNLRKFKRELKGNIVKVPNNEISYDTLLDGLHGWVEYARWANTYNLRKEFLNSVDGQFEGVISNRDIDRWQKSLNQRIKQPLHHQLKNAS
jgi:RNA-directed DNA polymerase